MSLETLRVSGEIADVGLVANDHTDHNLDPDVSSVTVNATENNVDTAWGGDFPTPSENPTVGVDLQEFRVGVLEFDSGQTGVPTARIELWENGSLVRAGDNTNVSTYAVLSFKWNASELATATGSLVQIKLIAVKSGGGPTKRNTVRIGHMEWNADVSAGPSTTQQAVAITHTTAEALVKTIGLPRVIAHGVAASLVKKIGIFQNVAHTVGVGSTKLIKLVIKTVGHGVSVAVSNANLFTIISAVTHTAAATLATTICHAVSSAITHTTAAALVKTIKMAKAVGHSVAATLTKGIKVSKSVSHSVSVSAAKTATHLFTSSVALTHTAVVVAESVVLFLVTVSVNLVHTFSLTTNVIFKNLGRALSRGARSWRRFFLQ